jgi:hypothetical protein
MVALMDLHMSHGGQPSHVSQSLRSHIPSFNLSMRWRSDMLPDRILVRMLMLFRLIRASLSNLYSLLRYPKLSYILCCQFYIRKLRDILKHL